MSKLFRRFPTEIAKIISAVLTHIDYIVFVGESRSMSNYFRNFLIEISEIILRCQFTKLIQRCLFMMINHWAIAKR